MKKHLVILKTLTRMWIVLSLICAVASCHTSKESSTDLITIDVEKIYNEPAQDLMLSEVVENIEYVKLETGPDCLVGKINNITTSDNFLAFYDNSSKRILLFTRSGMYLREIGRRGKGPGEYQSVVDLEISPDEKYLAFRDNGNHMMSYSIAGKFIGATETPGGTISGFGYRKKNQIAAFQQKQFLPEGSGDQLLLYNDQLLIADSMIYTKGDTTQVSNGYFAFDNFNICQGEIFFKQGLCDTIFKIGLSNEINPELVVRMGKYKFSKDWMEEAELTSKYLMMAHVRATKGFFYFTLVGMPRNNQSKRIGVENLLFNRLTNSTFFLKSHIDPISKKNISIPKPINNLDGIGDPFLFAQIRNGIDAQVIEIPEAKPFIESKDFDPSKLSTDKYYKKVKKLLDESDIEDNPIIRICYLK